MLWYSLARSDMLGCRKIVVQNLVIRTMEHVIRSDRSEKAFRVYEFVKRDGNAAGIVTTRSKVATGQIDARKIQVSRYAKGLQGPFWKVACKHGMNHIEVFYAPLERRHAKSCELNTLLQVAFFAWVTAENL